MKRKLLEKKNKWNLPSIGRTNVHGEHNSVRGSPRLLNRLHGMRIM